MKALLINVEENTVEYVEPESLFDYYDLIHCDLVDITNREIAGKRYDIICDDCGLFRENVKISAIARDLSPVLVGNLIISGEADEDGDQTDLQPEDIDHILDNIHRVRTRNYPKGYWMLCNVND